MDLRKSLLFGFITPFALIALNCVDKDVRVKSFYFGGIKRSYLVETPIVYSDSTKFPFIIILHGIHESGKFIKYRIGNNHFFSKNGILTVYPDGSGFIRKDWNDFENEISFINALLDTLFASYPIDTTKCYLAGFSQGGKLAYKTACRYSNRIAAIAIVSTSIDSHYVMNAPGFSRPVSLISINSKTDPACPIDSCSYKGKWFNSVLAGIESWKDKIGCSSDPEVAATPPCATMRRWKNPNGDETVLWITDNGGHAWPGGKGFLLLPHFQPSQCVNANQLIFDFFQKHDNKGIEGQ